MARLTNSLAQKKGKKRKEGKGRTIGLSSITKKEETDSGPLVVYYSPLCL